MGNHTPGPWVWHTSNSWRRLRRDDRGISQPVVEPFVAADSHPDLTVTQADMALISAAPELLEACEDMADALEALAEEQDIDVNVRCLYEETCGASICEQSGCVELRVRLARAAIAKATGDA